MTYHGSLSNYWKSVIWEGATGYDSIRTIAALYSRGHTRNGAFQCCFSDCKFARYDTEDMWYHIHFSRRHDPHGDLGAAYRRFLTFLFEGGEPLTTFK